MIILLQINNKMLCLGITATQKKCTNKITKNNPYCRYHKNQQSNDNLSKEIFPSLKIAKEAIDINNVDINDIDNQIGNDPCSICLCNVDENDDCLLICEHKHHVDCIKQLHEPFCPVCRVSLAFKTSKKINIDQIKKKSEKEKAIREKEQIQSSIDLAIALNETNISIETGSLTPIINAKTKEDELIEQVLQASILSEEIDDYEYLAKITEDSYYYAQKEDEALLQKVIKENIEMNKHDWCEEDVKTLMKGKKRIIMTLK